MYISPISSLHWTLGGKTIEKKKTKNEIGMYFIRIGKREFAERYDKALQVITSEHPAEERYIGGNFFGNPLRLANDQWQIQDALGSSGVATRPKSSG